MPHLRPTRRRPASRALRHRATLAAFIALALVACESSSGGPGPLPDTVATDTKVPDDGVGPTDTVTSTNRAPELVRIGDRVATVGSPLIILVEARDPDGDDLSYSVFGTLPEGARFAKAARRFEWTPTATGVTVFLTFVVSDGLEFDRETVRIEVSDTAAALPPAFVRVGDQQVLAGSDFALQLEATDPNGDTLTYGNEGALPAGATLDRAAGLFRWSPTADAVGTTARVTFTVSDGALSDVMSVRFVVTDGAGSLPPVFDPIPNQTATAGALFSLALAVSDPNGDEVTLTIDSGAPQGASLSGTTFTWTPAAADVGKTWNVVFAASDGTFTTLASVQLNVVSATTGACVDDANEPNETVEDATRITPGTYERTICESPGDFDVDLYVIDVPAQRLLSAELTFDAAAADLDLYLFDAAGDVIAASELVSSPERVQHVEAAGRDVFIGVIGFGAEPLRVGYELAVTVEAAPTDGCVDDDLEPNDSPATARPLPPFGTPLMLCGGDRDLWTFPVACGEQVEVGLDIAAVGEGDEDLDMRLFDSASAAGAPVGVAETLETFEIIEVASAKRPGTWLLEIFGYQEADEAAYELIVDTSGGCADDAVANGSAATAVALSGAAGARDGAKMCCTDDWFRLALAAGEQVTATVAVASGAGAIGLTALAPDGATQLASKVPTASGATLSFSAAVAGDHYLVATGAVDTTYDLSWSVAAGGACTPLSCGTYTVCDGNSGACVSDWCDAPGDCPADHACVETFCANPCDGDGDCRAGYACKNFAAGSRCGIFGAGSAGASCFDHTQCAAALICSTEKKCQ